MLLTILTFLLVLVFLVLAHELGHFLTAKKFGVGVEEFGLGFPPRLAAKKIKNTVYSLNILPLGGFVKIKGEDGETREPDSFAAAAAGRRALILSAGVGMNIITAWLLITILFLAGAPGEISDDIKPEYIKERHLLITQILPASPALAAGLSSGDEILAINGQATANLPDLQEQISRYPGQEIKALVSRNGEKLELTITPRLMKLEQGAEKISLGVGLVNVGTIKLPAHLAIAKGAVTTGLYLKRIVFAFGSIFKNVFTGLGLGNNIGGPVAIAVVTGGAVKEGLSQVAILTAILSLNLALINILPFPALDGGRLIFILIEKLRGRPSRREVEAWFHRVGFALLMLFAVFITYRDLLRFGGRIWQAVIN